MVSELSHTWLHWLPLTEFWYNNNYHSSINVSIWYIICYPSLIHIPYFLKDSLVTKVDILLRTHEATILVHKGNLQKGLILDENINWS